MCPHSCPPAPSASLHFGTWPLLSQLSVFICLSSILPCSSCLFLCFLLDFFWVSTKLSSSLPSLFAFSCPLALPLCACWCSCPYLASLRVSGSVSMNVTVCVCFLLTVSHCLSDSRALTKTHGSHGDALRPPPLLPHSLSLPVSLWFLSLSLRAPLHPRQPWHCYMGGTLTLVG